MVANATYVAPIKPPVNCQAGTSPIDPNPPIVPPIRMIRKSATMPTPKLTKAAASGPVERPRPLLIGAWEAKSMPTRTISRATKAELIARSGRLLGGQPAFAGACIDFQRRIEVESPDHFPAGQFGNRLRLFGRTLEQQLVVDLEHEPA